MFQPKKVFVLIGIFCITVFFTGTLSAENKDVTQIDIIFDASGSMWGQINGTTKIEIARAAMQDLINGFKTKTNIQLALRIYGHLNKKCTNSILEIPMAEGNHTAIIQKINSIEPLGKTPIAFSISQAVNDFNKALKGDKILILITDGIESCDGNTCQAAMELKKAGIVTTIHVVGFGMKESELASLHCIAEPFNGKLIGASNTKELTGAFKKISNAVAVKKNLEVLGVSKNRKPVYMDVDVLKGNEVIASSEGTAPLFSLEEGVYEISAKSRETNMVIKKGNISIEKGRKTRVEIVFQDARLKLKALGESRKPIYAFYTVYKQGTEEEILRTAGSGVREKTILPGTYDIKVYEQDTYATLWEKNVTLNPGDTFEKTFIFTMGNVVILPKTAAGTISTEYWWYAFFKPNSARKEKSGTAGVGRKELRIPPGTYTIKVLDGYNKVVQVIENIVVEANKTTEVPIKLNK